MRHTPERLGDRARALCADGRDELLMSVASAWEMAIKVSLGKLWLSESLDRVLLDARKNRGIASLYVRESHVVRLCELPPHHKDPFDRMLAAQALDEGLTLLSADTAFDAYGVPRLW